MSSDRTSEFMALARSMPSTKAAGYADPRNPSTTNTMASGRYGNSVNSMTPSQQTAYEELRNFHSTAGTISRDIAATSAMLSELTQLVRRRGLFVDDSDRVNYLVVRIKSSIENLNSRLDEASVQINSQKRRLGTQAGQEASNVVGQLKEEFVKATSNFKEVLQQRTDNIKEMTTKKRGVYGAASDDADPTWGEGAVSLSNRPPVYGTSSLSLDGTSASAPNTTSMKLDLTSGMQVSGEPTSSSSQLPRPRGVVGDGGGVTYGAQGSPGLRLRHSNSDILPTFSGSASTYQQQQGHNTAPLTPLDFQNMESGQEQTMQLIPDQDYLRERADAMTTVETNIVELGTIFNKLAVMVSEHREMVQRVEDNVDDADRNINLSLATLTDVLTNLRTNRALAMKVFGILALFIILFVVFFA